MKHLSFRSAAATLSGKKKALVAKEEAKYHLAFENEQRARRDLETLEAAYNQALSKVNHTHTHTIYSISHVIFC